LHPEAIAIAMIKPKGSRVMTFRISAPEPVKQGAHPNKLFEINVD
jgi:hypothetical protein